jgi:hypothetical protein
MVAQSPGSPNWYSFGTPLWESRDKKPFGCTLHERTQGEPLAGREATAPSIIRKVQIVQRGKEMPRNRGVILTQNVHAKPLFSEV